MLRLLLSNAQECKTLRKSSKKVISFHRKALVEHYQMSTHVPRFLSSVQVDQISNKQHIRGDVLRDETKLDTTFMFIFFFMCEYDLVIA